LEFVGFFTSISRGLSGSFEVDGEFEFPNIFGLFFARLRSSVSVEGEFTSNNGEEEGSLGGFLDGDDVSTGNFTVEVFSLNEASGTGGVSRFSIDLQNNRDFFEFVFGNFADPSVGELGEVFSVFGGEDDVEGFEVRVIEGSIGITGGSIVAHAPGGFATFKSGNTGDLFFVVTKEEVSSAGGNVDAGDTVLVQ